MAKRLNNENLANTKKPKIDELWGDDLDSDIIEDCFQLATQVCNEEAVACTQRNNITILPTYSSFKATKIYTSTQVIDAKQLTTPNNNKNKGGLDLDNKIKELQGKYEEKIGEVAILRANINELKTAAKTERERQQNEWKEKINATQKEADGVKSELEFKNLEIVNLKQKIKELSKISVKYIVKSPQKTVNSTREIEENVIDRNELAAVNRANYKLTILACPYYPLKEIDLATIFQLQSHKYFGKQRKKNVIDLDYIYPEISFLINLSHDEINQESTFEKINKIIFAFTHFLLELYNELRKQGSTNSSIETIEKGRCENAINPSKILILLSKLIFASKYLNDYLFLNKRLIIDSQNDGYVNIIPTDVNLNTEFYHLKLLLKITATLSTAKQMDCEEFLLRLVQFITNSFRCKISDNGISVLCDIVKEILFMKPNLKILLKVIETFQVASELSIFINMICTNSVRKSSKIQNFRKDFCIYYMFSRLMESVLSNISPSDLNFTTSLVFLNVIFNILEANPKWLHYSSNCCECLSHLYKSTVAFIFINVEKYKSHSNSSHNEQVQYTKLFKHSIRIMQLLTFNSIELIQSNIIMFAQYKEIILVLKNLQKELKFEEDIIADLDNLNITEDLPEISADSFKDVDI